MESSKLKNMASLSYTFCDYNFNFSLWLQGTWKSNSVAWKFVGAVKIGYM